LTSRSLISGSSRSALAFMQLARDPMERIYGHFRDLVGWIDSPIIVFVDDLDRCQPAYVVNLLEGIQTLFNDPRVVYVVAADRRWLHVCFEKTYENFSDAVKEPGRRLGAMFLEKVFELSVALPRLSPQTKKLYWDHLIRGEQSDIAQALDQEGLSARKEFSEATTEAQVLEKLQATTGDPLRDQVRKGVGIQQLASQEVTVSTEYFLQPFAPLMEPNPRAMKRLVNGYAVLRDMAILAGVDMRNADKRKQLALWTIVSLRWPLLEEFLEKQPEMIEAIRDREVDGIVPPELQLLTGSDEVRDVFNGEGVGAKLDKETVSAIAGFNPIRVSAASVA
ncbi:MAG TPA: P-loop NTPase fold protein, partial [Pyrinomonadaceae bacterium]|jgi:hypothetical protein|nr:P-loop NTPase fold protein [Pyrinomonadaceae bacterium]